MSKFLDEWNEFRILIESLNLDAHKGANGNKSAAIRTRKGLRMAKRHAAELIRQSLEETKD